MNRKESTKIIFQSFTRLPEVLQEAILSPVLTEKVTAIATKNGLSPEKAEVLELQTIFVLLGLLHPPDFIEKTAEALEVTEDKARGACQEINEQVFRPVRDELKKLYSIANTTPTTKQPLAAELEENVGLRKQLEQVKASVQTNPLSAVPQDTLRHPPAPPIPPTPIKTPEPTPPRPATPPTPPRFEPTHTSTSRSDLDVDDSRGNQIPPKWQPATQATAYENEAELNREEILRGIEDPSTIHTANEIDNLDSGGQPPQPSTPPQKPQAPYNSDPYREPLE